MSPVILYSVIAAVFVLLVVVLLAMYVKAPPSIAYVLSGLRKEPRILIGTGGFKIPIIE
jgi:flotillin